MAENVGKRRSSWLYRLHLPPGPGRGARRGSEGSALSVTPRAPWLSRLSPSHRVVCRTGGPPRVRMRGHRIIVAVVRPSGGAAAGWPLQTRHRWCRFRARRRPAVLLDRVSSDHVKASSPPTPDRIVARSDAVQGCPSGARCPGGRRCEGCNTRCRVARNRRAPVLSVAPDSTR